jgi:hypothetical protein
MIMSLFFKLLVSIRIWILELPVSQMTMSMFGPVKDFLIGTDRKGTGRQRKPCYTNIDPVFLFNWCRPRIADKGS